MPFADWARLAPSVLASISSQQVESDSRRFGNPPRFLFFGPAGAGGGAVPAGQSCRSVAKTFMVSVASVVKWSQRHRAVGSPAALKMGGKRPYLVARERDWVLARIAEKPDLTLRALLKELADRGLGVSYTKARRARLGLGISESARV